MITIKTEVQDEKRDRRGWPITSVASREELVKGYRASGLTLEQFAIGQALSQLEAHLVLK